MFKGYLKKYDDKVYSLIKIRDSYTVFFKIITTFGSTFYFILMGCLILIFLKDKTIAILIDLLLIINAIIISLVKNIIRRERPNIKRLVYEKSYSYPSGHTATSTAFYGFILFLVINSSMLINVKIALCFLLVGLILMIGFSRIYLGIHHFSDVVAGLLLASSYTLLYIYIVNNILNII